MNPAVPWQANVNKYTLLICTSLFLAGLFASKTTMAASVNKTITIVTQEWPPYQTSNGIRHSGFAIDALDCVMQRMKQPYKVIFLPWGRAQHDVKTKIYDGFFSASQNNHRDTYATLSNTFIEQKWQFYLNKDLATSLDPVSIKANTKFGSRQHSNTTHWLIKNDYSVIHQTSDLDELIKLLQKGRIGAVMENALLFKEAIKRAGVPLSEFLVVDNIDKPLGVYFGHQFLDQNPQFIDTFNQHTQACRYTSN